MTFYTYLMKHKKDESPIGDLARDVYIDPKNEVFKCSCLKARGFMRSYLEANGACSACLAAFDECYGEYQKLVRSERRR